MHISTSPITAAGILSPRGLVQSFKGIGQCIDSWRVVVAHRDAPGAGSVLSFYGSLSMRPALSRRCSISSFLPKPPVKRGGIRSGWRFGAAGVSAQLRVNVAVIVCQQGRSAVGDGCVALRSNIRSFQSQPGCTYPHHRLQRRYLVTAGQLVQSFKGIGQCIDSLALVVSCAPPADAPGTLRSF